MIYVIEFSNKKSRKINENELRKFKENVSASFVEMDDGGLVNPSFVVSIDEDVESSREESKRISRERTALELAPNPDRGTKKMAEILERNRPHFLLGEES